MTNDAARSEETHVKHAVGFVENERLDSAEINKTLIDEIEQSSRRRDENIGSLAECSDLCMLMNAAEHGRLSDVRVPQGSTRKLCAI